MKPQTKWRHKHYQPNKNLPLVLSQMLPLSPSPSVLSSPTSGLPVHTLYSACFWTLCELLLALSGMSVGVSCVAVSQRSSFHCVNVSCLCGQATMFYLPHYLWTLGGFLLILFCHYNSFCYGTFVCILVQLHILLLGVRLKWSNQLQNVHLRSSGRWSRHTSQMCAPGYILLLRVHELAFCHTVVNTRYCRFFISAILVV